MSPLIAIRSKRCCSQAGWLPTAVLHVEPGQARLLGIVHQPSDSSVQGSLQKRRTCSPRELIRNSFVAVGEWRGGNPGTCTLKGPLMLQPADQLRACRI